MERDSMCFFHTERPASSRCKQCRKPICDECAKTDANGRFCSFACSQKASDFQKREQPKPLKHGGLVSKILPLVLVLVLAAGAIYVGAKFLKIAFCIKLLKMAGLGL